MLTLSEFDKYLGAKQDARSDAHTDYYSITLQYFFKSLDST